MQSDGRWRSELPALALAGLLVVGLAGLAGCDQGSRSAPSAAAPAAAARVDAGATGGEVAGDAGALSRPPPGARPVPFETERACQADADCVLARAQCCGCEAGGRGLSINRRHLAAWHARLDGSCGEIMCPQVMSPHPSCRAAPACLKGQCGFAGGVGNPP